LCTQNPNWLINITKTPLLLKWIEIERRHLKTRSRKGKVDLQKDVLEVVADQWSSIL
jgi:hypothetical protein